MIGIGAKIGIVGCTAFATEDAAKGRHRDGAARSDLQSHPGHEHHGGPIAPGGNAGIVEPG